MARGLFGEPVRWPIRSRQHHQLATSSRDTWPRRQRPRRAIHGAARLCLCTRMASAASGGARHRR